jgi:hypothetical protein
VRTSLFWLSEAVVICVIAFPVFGFLLFQWRLRKLEFTSRFANKDLTTYFSRFYALGENGLNPMMPKMPRRYRIRFEKACPGPGRDGILFDWLFDQALGRWKYVWPTELLLVE